MFSSEQFNAFAKEMLKRVGGGEYDDSSRCGKNQCGNSTKKSKVEITPSQALVIAGILGGTLDVVSVVMNKDQTVEIVLAGSLKRKSDLEKMFDKVGQMPFDEVLKAMMGRI